MLANTAYVDGIIVASIAITKALWYKGIDYYITRVLDIIFILKYMLHHSNNNNNNNMLYYLCIWFYINIILLYRLTNDVVLSQVSE